MRTTIVVIALIGIIVGLSLIRAVVSNGMSPSGVELSVAQAKLKVYQTENSILKEKINELSSLTYISMAATRLGFTESKSSFAVSSAQPIAFRQ